MSPGVLLTDYERKKLERIRENQRQLEALGLKDMKKEMVATPKVKAQRRPKSSHLFLEERPKSARVMQMPPKSYRDMDGERSSRGGRGGGRDGTRNPSYLSAFVSTKEAQEAEDAATALARELSCPCMVKRLVRSNVSGCFWLGLSAEFCRAEMPREETTVTLEDEDGRKWDTIYKVEKTALSGGWRGFSIDHKLDAGDAILFELVEQDRMKVHIFRAAHMPTAVEAGLPSIVLDPKENQYESHMCTVRAKVKKSRTPKEEGSGEDEDKPRKSGNKKAGENGEERKAMTMRALKAKAAEAKRQEVKKEEKMKELKVKEEEGEEGGEEEEEEEEEEILQSPRADKRQTKRKVGEILSSKKGTSAKKGAEEKKQRRKGPDVSLVLSAKRRKSLRA